MSKQFNDAFRRALRPQAKIEEPPGDAPPRPAMPRSVDAGAGTAGARTPAARTSMNDLIRRAKKERA